jgi:hypothetical protein
VSKTSLSNVYLLFSGVYLRKLLTTGLIWFSTAFSFYGLDYLFVLTLRRLQIQQQDGDTLGKILYSSLMQIFIPVVAATVGHYYQDIKRCILIVQLFCGFFILFKFSVHLVFIYNFGLVLLFGVSFLNLKLCFYLLSYILSLSSCFLLKSGFKI